MKKKADVIFLIAVLSAAAALWAATRFFSGQPGHAAVVMIDGAIYERFPLSRDTIVSLPGADGGYNLLEISGSGAAIIDADCPDRLCMRQKPVTMHGESIICLPHRLTVRIEGGEEGGPDAVTF